MAPLFYAPEVTFTINKLQTTVRNELRLLGSCNRVYGHRAGQQRTQYWFLGAANGLEVVRWNGGNWVLHSVTAAVTR